MCVLPILYQNMRNTGAAAAIFVGKYLGADTA
jgi:hypothetical protein